MAELPSGNVTFLFTDVEGSTRLLERDQALAGRALQRHHELLRQAVESHDGCVFETVGDAVYAAFAKPGDAVAAACQAQLTLQAEDWGEAGALRVRMGLHSGEVERWGDHYFGPALFRCARLMAAGHGGQVLLSGLTAGCVADHLPEGASLREMGLHSLKDLTQRERIWQLVHHDLPSEFPPLRLPAAESHLPLLLTSFIGREKEVAEVKRLLIGSRLLTLTGPAGVGKTRLAVEVARATLAPAHPVYFVALAGIDDSSLVPGAIARAVGVLDDRSSEPLVVRLKLALSGQPTLLVLDNFEHLLPAAFQVGELLQGCPQLQILATSRRPLGLYGEQELPLTPLETGRDGSNGAMELSAARLFFDRAAAVRHGFSASGAQAQAIVDICARLDGLPLAIELAAARMKVLTPLELSGMLARPLDVLVGGPSDWDRRQQTLRSTLAWSYELLGPEERHLFERFAAFPAACNAPAIQALYGDHEVEELQLRESLWKLASSSIIIADTETGLDARYRMLEPIRAFARELFEQRPDVLDIRRRQAAYFVDLAERAEPFLFGAEQSNWLDQLELEHENIGASLSWCLSADREAGLLGLRLAAALGWFWYVRGHWAAGRTWLQSARTTAGEAAPRPVLAKALGYEAVLSWSQNDFAAASELASEGFDIARCDQDRPRMAFTKTVAALSSMLQGHLEDTQARLEEALELCEAAGYRWGTGVGLIVLGNCHLWQGRLEREQELSAKGLEIVRSIGDPWAIAMGVYDAGLAAMQRHEANRAVELLSAAVELYRACGAKGPDADSIRQLGRAELERGNADRAGALFRESLRIYRQVGSGNGIAQCFQALGEAYVRRGLAPEALELCAAADRLQREIGAVMPAPEQEEIQAMIAAARLALGPSAGDEAWNRGLAIGVQALLQRELDGDPTGREAVR